MPARKRSSPQSGGDPERWLGSGESARSRPWAYEEFLFGPRSERARSGEIAMLVAELESERRELAALCHVLDARLERISGLEERLKELTSAPGPEEQASTPTASLPRSPALTYDHGAAEMSPAERGYALSRCQGFEVESQDGPVGIVEGLRFVTRIDRPDILEVRGGRFGRELLLIPVEQVNEVRIADEVVVVQAAPLRSGDLVGDLVERFRKALHLGHAAS